MKYKTLKVTKRYGGGGGSPSSSTVNTPTLPDWAVPYVQNTLGSTQNIYGGGDLSRVAGTSQAQDMAFGAGANAIAGTTGSGLDALSAQQGRLTSATQSGGYDTGALKDKAILEAGAKTAALGNQYGASGTLGSGRQAVAQGAQNAATAAQFAGIDRDAAQQNFQNKMTAEGALGQSVNAGANLASSSTSALANLGAQERTISQQQLDAPWQGLQRYASTIYGQPGRNQASTVQSGGGGK